MGSKASRSRGAPLPPQPPDPPSKLQHDREQQDYLNGGSAAAAPVKFRLEEGGRVDGHAVNPDTSGGEIAARWQTSRPQIAVIDNLLTDEALARLRRFCWGSTIWRKAYRGGYLGAMPEHGFACPLLAQIAEELRSAYPAILERQPLLQLWGFKYDSRLSGINIHADFAAVNVNFWITPDEANLDPDGGGLVVWDAPAPLGWDFAKYNDDAPAARDFLTRAGARPVTIPYRANRAVIFDSDLFHETDRIAFKEGYLNRRINITLLYGRRETTGGAAARPRAEGFHPLIPVDERVKKPDEGRASPPAHPRGRGEPAFAPLNVHAVWQILGSRVRGNERMWQFLHTLERGNPGFAKIADFRIPRSRRRAGGARG